MQATVESQGYCVVVVSEGLRNAEGKFLAKAGTRDACGHAQLGGVGPVIAQLVKDRLGYKYHWAVADYLQRAARHGLAAWYMDLGLSEVLAIVALFFAMEVGLSPILFRLRIRKKPY